MMDESASDADIPLAPPSGESGVVTRDATPDDRTSWSRLWRGYNDFYGVAVPDEVTETVWARIVGLDEAVGAKIALLDGRVAGFAVRVLHPFTWGIGPACLLEDLFVDPLCRGRGVARALIDTLLAECSARGWERLYWHTRQDNATARRLYDTYTQADGFVRYSIPIGQQSSFPGRLD